MARKLQAIDITQFHGLNTLDDPISLSPFESPYMLNMDITKTGALISRFGFEQVAEISGTGGMSGALPYYRTYDDNTAIDQSQDPTANYPNTYAVPVLPISETATNKCTFTPTKSDIIRIGVYIVAKGTGAWTMTLHDASNTVLGSITKFTTELTNSAWNYFAVPYTWTSGALHFHLTSTVADGTVKANTSNDLSTASFLNIYSTKGDYLLLFYDGNAYYLTNAMIAAGTAPTLIGAYGTENGAVRGTTIGNQAIFGNGAVGNEPKKWNVVTLAGLTSPVNARIFSKFQDRLFATGVEDSPSTVYYADISTPGDNLTSGVITINQGDGEVTTAMIANNDFLQVFKEDSIHGINFSFDNTYAMTLPQQQQIVNSNGGCVAPGSAQAVYGYTYYLSKEGFETYGPSQERIVADIPLPLSLKIDPTIQNINSLYTDAVEGAFYDKKYLCATPLGNSEVNNGVFVYNESVKKRLGIDNWVLYSGLPVQQFAIFRDANKRKQLYFTSNAEPKLYRMTPSFSDDGFGYMRLWRSKTFQVGENTHYHYVDIEGSKPIGTEINVRFTMDNRTSSVDTIGDENFILSSTGGGYVGDNYIGDSYYGNASTTTESVPMYRFKKRVRVPDTVNEGYNMFFEIYNEAEQQGWKLTRIKIIYESNADDPTYSFTD